MASFWLPRDQHLFSAALVRSGHLHSRCLSQRGRDADFDCDAYDGSDFDCDFDRDCDAFAFRGLFVAADAFVFAVYGLLCL
mmetsp:Transcript_2814/g.8275  ORF Transcript_2814/g.8275 Transcript_2814/m.8275 type:complete len:81 (+) Transcript_2814:391-633(+)